MRDQRYCPRCDVDSNTSGGRCARCDSPLLAVAPSAEMMCGRVLADRFHLEAVIGRGGNGVVFRATDLAARRSVAVKMLLCGGLPDVTTLRRFRREAALLTSFDHPHIVPVLADGVHDGVPFLVTPLAEHGSLAQLLATSGALSPATCRVVAEQLLSALAVVHRAGVVHRDLKPSNILVLENHGGSLAVALCDFGIAHLEDRSAASLTSTGNVVGTMHYLAPECLHGSRADARSDLYSLGVTLYECLTGRSPFGGMVTGAVVARKVSGVVDWDAVTPTMRPLLRGLVDARPERRFASTTMAFRALDSGAAGRTESTRTTARAIPHVPRTRSRWTLFAAAILALSLWPGPAPRNASRADLAIDLESMHTPISETPPGPTPLIPATPRVDPMPVEYADERAPAPPAPARRQRPRPATERSAESNEPRPPQSPILRAKSCATCPF